MKLYTEEQKRYLHTLFNYFHEEHNLTLLNQEMEEIVNIVKNNYLELPSDEEIGEESPYVPSDASLDFWAHKEGFIDGAKWMRDKIQGGKL